MDDIQYTKKIKPENDDIPYEVRMKHIIEAYRKDLKRLESLEKYAKGLEEENLQLQKKMEKTDAWLAEEPDRQAAIQSIKTCSALRIIPDALPSFKNEEALLASLNRIFNLSGWSPESLSPSGDASSEDEESAIAAGLNPIELNLSIEADTGTTMNVLGNIERSIREFDINQATIEWSGDNSLTLKGRGTAYYVDESTVNESSTTITGGD